MVVNAITEVAGRKPLVVGKPNRFMLDCIVGKHCDIDFSRTVFVGDRLQTDVKFAKTNGIDSVLVLTGVGKVEDIDSNPELTPNYVMHSLSDIVH
jgi:ribonucleotide monophosphatase NagD (HAD superfamily)